jgi:predicted amidohydrolase
MEVIMNSLLGTWLRWKLREARIRRSLSSTKALESCRKGGVRGIRAAAVQRKITLVKSIEAYIDIMEGFVKSAAEQDCDIIAFPEYNFFDLLGVIPGFNLLNRCLNRKQTAQAGSSSDSGLRKLYPLLCSISIPIQAAIESIMCGLALKYSIYIYSGSYFIKEKDHLYNGGAIISREGDILGRQMKLHLTDFEDKLGIKRDNEFKVFTLDIGNIAFPVCMDATYYEVFNLARSRDCDVIVLPIANSEEYRLHRALRGIWPRVQESHVYGIKSALNGWFCGLHFTGKAGVFAPIGMTPMGDGVVAVSEHPEGDSLIVGDIDLDALYKEREEDEYYGDSNPKFEKAYYFNTYLLHSKG